MVKLLEQALKIHGGFRLDANKSQSLRIPLRQARIPERLFVPLSQHIGEADEPLVEVGDSILKGQPIARSLSYISAPVHAPTSGRIIDIGAYPIPHPSGLKADCIVIDADGLEVGFEVGVLVGHCRFLPYLRRRWTTEFNCRI